MDTSAKAEKAYQNVIREANDQWRRLESVLELLGRLSDRAPALTNSEVCQARESIEAPPIVSPAIQG